VIKVWLASAPSAELNDHLREQIAQTVSQRAYTTAGATWDIETVRCPIGLHNDVATNLESITVDQVKAVGEIAEKPKDDETSSTSEESKTVGETVLKEADKLFLLCVRAEMAEFIITVRELDCRSRTWRPTISRRVVQPERIADECFAAIADAFSPVVRIEMPKGREAQVRVRAGGLIWHDEEPITSNLSPSHIRHDDVLLPIIRRNNRVGEPLKGGVQVIPWSFLTITERKGNVLNCKVHSGMRSALGGRSSSRTIKLALVAKPRGESTRLRVESRDATPIPLSGYEIYAKDPETEESELVGKTDWRGVVEIPTAERPLRILYVRNGGRLLARLPVVPGLEPELTAQVSNDDQRLKAEGFVKGLQTRVMDLVARRELYKSRFRRHLKRKELDKAKALLEEFRNLETRSDLSRQLLQEEQRITSPDRRVQARIDQLFKDTRQLLSRFLDPGTANELAQELAEAQRRSS